MLAGRTKKVHLIAYLLYFSIIFTDHLSWLHLVPTIGYHVAFKILVKLSMIGDEVLGYQINIIKSKYFYLLIVLTLFFITNPFLVDNRLSNIILFVAFSLVMFLSLYIVSDKKLLTYFTIFFALLSYLSYYYVIWIRPDELTYIIHFIFNLLFLGSITYAIIFSVVQQKEISADTLFGAICGYLLIGLTWTYLYLLIVSIDASSFSIHLNHDGTRARIDHFIYYSFVTLTTTGYGDILALKSVPRTFSWLEAVVGQVYLAVWISQLVGLRIIQQQKLN
jgi:voltage-gated potassium channel